MEVGTKLEMDNGELGIQQGVIVEVNAMSTIIAWDVPEEDEEELGDNFKEFGIRILPADWKFTYITDDGNLK